MSTANRLKNKILLLTSSVDVALLLFLVLVLNVSLAIKLAALVFMYAVRFNFKFGLLKGRLPLFYPAIACLAAIQLLLNCYRGINYVSIASLAVFFWLASLLIMHQLKLAIEKSGIAKVEKALAGFFILNAIVSAVNLIRIMFEIQDSNPYMFDGLSFKYSASTGDYIKGIMADLSTANMFINSFGIFYFLYQRNYLLSFMCYAIALFTTSNLGNFIILLFFVFILIADRSKFNKSIILCYLSFLIVFILKISPSNLNYLNVKSQQLFHLNKKLITTNWHDQSEKEKLIDNYINKSHKDLEIKKTEKQIINNLMIEKEKKIHEQNLIEDSNYIETRNKDRNRFVVFYTKFYGDTAKTLNRPYYDKYPGKYLSFIETFNFVNSSVPAFFIGAGPVNFSSKLAYKASNLGVSGKYIEKLAYVSPEFKANHLKLSLSYYTKSPDEHSILNFPNSVFNQLLGEYGVVGVILFLGLYVWFYVKRFKSLTFGKIVLPAFLMFLLTDYWFECFSIVIIFEIMMFIDMAKNTTPTTNEANT